MPNWQRKESEKVMRKEKNRELIRTVKFVLFSISAGVIQILSFTLLNELMTWPYWPSYLIAITLSVLWNFTLNRRFTFKSANNVPIAMAQTAAFYVVFTPLSTLLGNYLVESLLWNEYLVTIINMLSNFVLEYLFQRFVVFRNSLDTNDLAKKEQNAK
jgi:putative flippase GtrA